MNLLKSRTSHLLCLCMVLFRSLEIIAAAGQYFVLVQGAHEPSRLVSQHEVTHKKFFQCGRQEFCTHIIKTQNDYVLVHGIEELGMREHQAMYIYEKQQPGHHHKCASNPCVNGGTCKDELLKYSCTCLAGYTGTNCEQKINECESGPCQNGGQCIDGSNKYTCNCEQPFIGPNCQYKLSRESWSPCKCTSTHVVDLSPRSSKESCYLAAKSHQGTAATYKNGQCLCCYAAVVYSEDNYECRLI